MSSLTVIPFNHMKQMLETTRHAYPVCICNVLPSHHVKMCLEKECDGVG
jgi:hypothetical protein